METNKILIIILVVILVVMLFRSHVTVIQPQPIKPVPIPVPVKPIGGCAGTRYGCCPDGRTPRINPMGTNCP
jgi:hypothetical protein